MNSPCNSWSHCEDPFIFPLIVFTFNFFNDTPNLITQKLQRFLHITENKRACLFFLFFFFFLIKFLALCFDVEKTNSFVVCDHNNCGIGYVCVGDCFASHICFPPGRQGRPLFESQLLKYLTQYHMNSKLEWEKDLCFYMGFCVTYFHKR